MIRLYPTEQWHTEQYEWLKAQYLYSFANYYDPDRMGFGALRVVNHDVIAAGKGFDLHPHSNMEIVTILLEGELRHVDTLGHQGVLKPGHIQHMSAGTGIQHMEINSGSVAGRGFQVWIEPETYHKEPDYQMVELGTKPYTIRNDVTLERKTLRRGDVVTLSTEEHSLCVLVGYGSIEVHQTTLNAGSAIEVDVKSPLLSITANEDSTIYLIAQSVKISA